MLCCDNQKDYLYSMKYYTFISPIYLCVGINKCVLIQGIIYMQYDMTCQCLLGIFTRKILHFHEYSMLCCDKQKGSLYSMKCYAFIYSIYIYICGYK